MPDIQANGITIHYESLGRDTDPPIVLVMGLALQMIFWPDQFCQMLVDRGFRVIRFDNRDVGLSSHFDHLGKPNLMFEYARHLMGFKMRGRYQLDDMARDTIALVEALGLTRVHLVGASMGGMIAQNVAAMAPEKIITLTSMMSTTGRRSLPQPSWAARGALFQPPPKQGDIAAATRRSVRVFQVIGSKTYPPAPGVLEAWCERHAKRGMNPAGAVRQLMAIAAAGDRTKLVRTIKVPTLVLHGDEDCLVPPTHGMETARVIREGGGQATFMMIEGMGHDLPLPLLPQIVGAIGGHCLAVA